VNATKKKFEKNSEGQNLNRNKFHVIPTTATATTANQLAWPITIATLILKSYEFFLIN